MSRIQRGEPPPLSRRTGGVRPRSPSEALEPGRPPRRPKSRRQRPPSRAMSALVRWVSGIFTVGLVLMLAVAGSGLLLFHQFEQPGPLEAARTVVIPKGDGRIEIAERLEREGIISSRWVFLASHLAQSWMGSKPGVELKAGEYEIKKAASMREVLDVLGEGRAVLYKLTIAEGLTSKQIVERIRAESSLTGEIAEIPAEGTLLPDTYKFSKGMDRRELLTRMQLEQRRVLENAWAGRQKDLPIATVEQAIVLASIVEKETGRADERDKVASVFVNRLRKGMRLQSDPTIIYGLAPGEAGLGRPLTRADIDSKSAYNTYQIDGLPPGPICNPGRASIEATLKPATTADLYFVADGSGGHAFSETLKDHNAAVANWRKLEKEMRSKQEAASATDDAAGKQAGAKQGEGKPGNAKPGAPGKVEILNAATQAQAPAAAGEQADAAIPSPPAEDTAGAEATAGTPVASTVPLPVRKPKKP